MASSALMRAGAVWKLRCHESGGPGPEPSPTPEPTPSPTPSPSPSPTTPACTAPAWSAGAVYTGGATVSHAGSTYTARWWTQGETPGTSQWGAWAVVGTC